MTIAPASTLLEADLSVVAELPEHDELRAVMRQLLRKEGSHEALRAAVDTEIGYSEPLWARLNKELEISSMVFPEESGGGGFGMRELSVVLEETGAFLSPEPVLMSSILSGQALASAQGEADVARIRGAVMCGSSTSTLALMSPEQSGVRATRAAGSWRINGRLTHVLQAAAADYLILAAAVSGGGGIFVINLREGGVSVSPLHVLDFTRRQDEVVLVDVPAVVLVPPEAYEDVRLRLGDAALVAVASEHTGIIAHLLELTVDYVVQRQQFGRPIGSFQAVKHRLADVLVDLERARSASRYAAAAFDRDPSGAMLPAAVAAAVCCEAVIRVAHEAIQLHGGIGFTWEHPAHLYLRRGLGDEGLFGSALRHRKRIAELVGL